MYLKLSFSINVITETAIEDVSQTKFQYRCNSSLPKCITKLSFGKDVTVETANEDYHKTKFQYIDLCNVRNSQ